MSEIPEREYVDMPQRSELYPNATHRRVMTKEEVLERDELNMKNTAPNLVEHLNHVKSYERPGYILDSHKFPDCALDSSDDQ